MVQPTLPADAQAYLKTLAVRIERAWIALTESSRSVSRTYYLTWDAKIIRKQGHPSDSEEIGSYTPAIGLDEFRKDVYFVWDYMHGCHSERA